MKKIDERDTMFARMSYEKNSDCYNDYYKRNEHLKEKDDLIKEMPNICSEGTVFYDEIFSKVANANFELLSNLRHLSNIKAKEEKVNIPPLKATNIIKNLCTKYGALDCSIVELKDYHYYSHRGRHPENYGEKITENIKHKYAIIFTLKMDKDIMNMSPRTPVVIESSKAYVDGAIIGLQLGQYISYLGFDSFVQMDANYLINLTRVANDSSLGEVGRNGLLITKNNGCAVRLGAVTTNMPLIPCENKNYGIKDKLCKNCDLCSLTCPPKAINNSSDENNWGTDQVKCYERWRMFGTDCGICISSCPVTQGIDFSLLDTNDGYKKILENHKNKYNTRNYIIEDPSWFK